MHRRGGSTYSPAAMRTTGLLLLIAVAAPAAAEEAQPLTLDEAIRLGRDHNRDLRATREHLVQSQTDVTRAWVPLLPTVAAQGKYTLNNKEITVSFAPASSSSSSMGFDTSTLSGLNAKLQADIITAVGSLGTPQGNAVLMDAQNLLTLAAKCQQDPNQAACEPVIIQKLNQLDLNLNALVPVIVPWAYPELSAAKRTYESQQASADVSEATLLLQVASQFYAAAGNDEVVAARKHGVEVARQTLENAKARVEAGVANRVDVTRAESALVRAEQTLREAQDTADAAYRSLATMIQLRDPFRVVAAAEPPPLAEPDDALVRDGLKLRPELLALDKQVTAASQLVWSAKLKWLPTVSLFGFFRLFNAQGFGCIPYAFGGGVQADWQLFDGGLRLAQQWQSESAEVEAHLRWQAMRDQINDEIVTARQNLETRRRAVETARR